MSESVKTDSPEEEAEAIGMFPISSTKERVITRFQAARASELNCSPISSVKTCMNILTVSLFM
jgi:hypothetical protein